MLIIQLLLLGSGKVNHYVYPFLDIAKVVGFLKLANQIHLIAGNADLELQRSKADFTC